MSDREVCVHGMRVTRYCPQCEGSTGDARAFLWAGAFLAEFCIARKFGHASEICRRSATHAADDAVTDFDEHYLGRKPSEEAP